MRLDTFPTLVVAAAFSAACAHSAAELTTPLTVHTSQHQHDQHDAHPHGAAHAGGSFTVRVDVDAARREVVVHAGPFDVPAADPDGHAHGTEGRTPLIPFEWPVDGWIRGFRIMVFDADGLELPRDIMHHLIGYNFTRPQLIHPGVERLFGAGRETGDVVLPRSAGVPLPAGSQLGFDAVWHNETGRDLTGVTVRVALPYTPPRRKPVAYEGYPFHVDVNYSVDGSNEFDVPPGRSEQSVEFVMPISGRLIGIGGHMHDYGVALRLEDAETDNVLFSLRGGPDPSGLWTVERKVFRRWAGLRSGRMQLEAGRRYRLVSEYDNPTGDVLVRGAMAHVAGLIRPLEPDAWPTLDPDDPTVQLDIAILRGEVARRSEGEDDHHHRH